MTTTADISSDGDISSEFGQPARRRPGRRTATAWAGRIAGAALVLWAAATTTFLLQALAPGDRATLLLNLAAGQSRDRTPDELAPVNAKYGFTDPLGQQYLDYLGGLLRGDLGTSYQLQEPVLSVILDQIAPTLVLTATALALAWLIVITATMLGAGRRGPLAGPANLLETVAAGLPHYWLGVILLVVFAIELSWFPVESGSGPRGLVLPALTLAVPLSGFLGQVTRAEFARALDQPHVLSARARGLGDTATRFRHVLRHSLIPALSISGWAMGALFGGAVIAETVFARAGIGQTLVAAAESRDVPLVSGIVVAIATVYVLANLVVDFLYTVVDPRISAA
ncbi:ABC transporter permease [Nocardia sp. BMG51109]|uniref:ABC transporter permease n=1 Tax=Nocardia sp. BMG51109 TaxID=1056816 RepID=UPI00046418E0|nr:ABC transporter permease [Nocardia sp. BMG51109]